MCQVASAACQRECHRPPLGLPCWLHRSLAPSFLPSLAPSLRESEISSVNLVPQPPIQRFIFNLHPSHLLCSALLHWVPLHAPSHSNAFHCCILHFCLNFLTTNKQANKQTTPALVFSFRHFFADLISLQECLH